MSPVVIVNNAPIDAGAESGHIHAATAGDAGAVLCFSGAVRGGDVLAMTLEHYPDMTELALRDIAVAAEKRWALLAVRVRHRVGRMMPGEIIVFVGVATTHRADAFAAGSYIMDYLKTQAPFWKKEETTAGCRWVDARDTDDDARNRWE
ncbi:molybdenum cofactor biosynthesis protein MoaE [Candidatus Persebacteraceae bacterium Df01]|jgi:molybdopterin synthase catalytic subunit|uniref:Molybdopterin synthase catalytic subunit n=1 Tax=Candidatus Doriopsillibacter californiensis TaxID=2970740 RepID=A0ABT7QLW1_9GAMM|nr:molybdenum cofactor biosynthesis protein MoaE [Candidatus Persebacteraceae bacterium Df01]